MSVVRARPLPALIDRHEFRVRQRGSEQPKFDVQRQFTAGQAQDDRSGPFRRRGPRRDRTFVPRLFP